MEIPIEPLEEPSEAPAHVGAGSTLDRIKALYKQAATEQTIDLLVPGFEPKRGRPSDLGVRYRALDPDEKSELLQRDGLIPSYDHLITACVCLLARENGVLEPITVHGEYARFDGTANIALDLNLPTSSEEGGSARDELLAVFRKVPDPPAAIGRHFVRWMQWSAGDGQVDEERLLGES